MNIEKKLLKDNKKILGLILILYSLISFTNGIGNYFRFPFSFLFGFIGNYLMIPLIFIAGLLLIFNIQIKTNFKINNLIFIFSLIFLFPLVTGLAYLFNAYESFSVSSSYISKSVFNGGFIGNTIFNAINFLFKNNVTCFIVIAILYVLPFVLYFTLFKENKHIVKTNEYENQFISNKVVDNDLKVETIKVKEDESLRYKRNINVFDDDIKINKEEDKQIVENIAPSFTLKKEESNSNVEISNVKIVDNQNINKENNDLNNSNYENIDNTEYKKEENEITDKDVYDSIVSNNFESEIDEYDEIENEGIVGSSSYVLPSLDLLNDVDNSEVEQKNKEIAKEKATILTNKFNELGLNATINNFVVGPSITRFEIALAAGVRVSSFLNLQEDFKLALAATSIRILNPISDTIPALGLEIPNVYRSDVTLKEVMKDIPNKKEKLYVPLGKDVSGNNISVALTKMPHAIISGATNSGKSVCLYTLVASLILQYKPNELKMLLVDPKHVDLAFYDDLPFLLCPVIDDFKQAYVALLKIEKIVRNRFDKIKEACARDFESYNEKMTEIGMEKMPFYLVVIDEFADLVDDEKFGNLIINQIDKIVRIGRGAGVNVIIATQRADTTVINGTIKNNFPARFTFRLSSFADSKTVLNGSGAEKLLNNGDMLLLTPDYSGLRRLQGAFITDEAIYRVTDYIKEQMPANFDPRFMDLRTEEEKLEEYKQNQAVTSLNKEEASDDVDETKYKEVVKYVVINQVASVTTFRVKLGLSYIEAAKMIDKLESDGIIGPKSSSFKGREVLIKDLKDIENK